MLDLSIICPSNNPKNFYRLTEYIGSQRYSGINVEYIFIQESDDHSRFNISANMPLTNIKIIRSNLHYDYGAHARDLGILESRGEYLAFWDDDNIYYEYAIASIFCTVYNFDIGLTRTHHQNIIIPIDGEIKPGFIDTMCIGVKRDLAIKEKWDNNGGKYCDYRWLIKLLSYNPTINKSKIIIGAHL